MTEQSDLLNQLRIERGPDEPPRSRAPIWIALALVVVLGGAALAWWLLAGSSAVIVKTAVAQPFAASAGNASVLDATGYVTARRQATVSSKVTGKVAEVRIEEGQRVEADEILARLDPTDAQAAFDLARAQREAARAQLADLRVQLAQAERDDKRQNDLVARKLVSTQAVENARMQVDSLRARLAAQQGNVAVAERNLDLAQVGLDNMIVKAPFAGVVTVKAAQPGEIVSPISAGGGFTRTGIGTIVDMDSLEIEVDVNEAYINRVIANQPVSAVLNAYPDWKIPAHVIAIIPTADRSKATVKVRIGLDAKDARIVPDMGVRVSFLEDAKAAAPSQAQAPRGVLVPQAALRKDGDKDIVFVVRNAKAERRAVTLGGNVGDSRQVLGGVAAGESVVTEAPPELKDGAAVAPPKS